MRVDLERYDGPLGEGFKCEGNVASSPANALQLAVEDDTDVTWVRVTPAALEVMAGIERREVAEMAERLGVKLEGLPS